MQVHRACLALLAVAAAHERFPEHSVGSAADSARDIRALAASHGDQSELVRAAEKVVSDRVLQAALPFHA